MAPHALFPAQGRPRAANSAPSPAQRTSPGLSADSLALCACGHAGQSVRASSLRSVLRVSWVPSHLPSLLSPRRYGAQGLRCLRSECTRSRSPDTHRPGAGTGVLGVTPEARAAGGGHRRPLPCQGPRRDSGDARERRTGLQAVRLTALASPAHRDP